MSVIDISTKGRLRREGSSSISGLSFSPDDSPSTHPKLEKSTTQTNGYSHQRRAILLIILLSCMISAVFFFDKESLRVLVLSLEENKNGYGMLLFLGISVISSMCLFPGPILATFAGAVYGKVWGAMLIWSAGTLCQNLTFLLGKYLLRDALVAFVSKRYKSFPTIDAVIAQQGWKIVLLLRLSPIIPDSVLNYVLAATSIPYIPYSISSSIAILPWTITFTYIGSFATDVSSASSGNGVIQSGWLTLLSIISVILLVAFGCFIARTARRALADVMDDTTNKTIT